MYLIDIVKQKGLGMHYEWVSKELEELQPFRLIAQESGRMEEVMVALEQDTIVGVIGGYDECCVAIEVLPSYRRQGVGTALVERSGMFYPIENNAPDFWETIEV